MSTTMDFTCLLKIVTSNLIYEQHGRPDLKQKNNTSDALIITS